MIETTLDPLTVSLFGLCDYLRWIGHFHCFGHLDQLRLFGSLLTWNGLVMSDGLVRPFGNLVIMNRLVMRDGLFTSIGLGI